MDYDLRRSVVDHVLRTYRARGKFHHADPEEFRAEAHAELQNVLVGWWRRHPRRPGGIPDRGYVYSAVSRRMGRWLHKQRGFLSGSSGQAGRPGTAGVLAAVAVGPTALDRVAGDLPGWARAEEDEWRREARRALHQVVPSEDRARLDEVLALMDRGGSGRGWGAGLGAAGATRARRLVADLRPLVAGPGLAARRVRRLYADVSGRAPVAPAAG